MTTTATAPVGQTLGAFAASARLDDAPADVQASTRLLLLDTLGALLGMALLVMTVPWAVRLLGLGPIVEQLAASPDTLGAALLVLMLGTFLWDLLTWWMGLPASTWHAFFGTSFGVSLVIGTSAAWDRLGLMLAVSVVGPVISATVAYLLMQLILRLARSELLGPGHIRFAQTFSASTVAAAAGRVPARCRWVSTTVAAESASMYATRSAG